MIDIKDKSKCNGCHACVNSCPQKCIHMIQDVEGFLYPQIDTNNCISCGKCNKVCPVINNNTHNPVSQQIGYAAYNKDTQMRLHSSSGGIFTLLAEQILGSGGVVVGAAMNDDCKSVHHVIVDSVNDLAMLRGSKYVQSTIGDIYTKVRDILAEGRMVLFTGTPCQIGGLYSYLGKDYSNLYTQDLICHGVPSPLIWRKYVEYREKGYGAVARRTSFRHKKYGWKRYSVLFQFSNNTEYLNDFHNDAFMKGFLRNLYLRPSCYSCSFKTLQRQADITLADYWGVEQLHPEIDDDKGTSFVWIHSKKGLNLFNLLSDEMISIEINCDDAIRINSAAVKSCTAFKKRKVFFEDIERYDFECVINKYSKLTLYEHFHLLLRKVKRRIMH